MLTNVNNPMLDAVRGTPTHFEMGWSAADHLPSSGTDAFDFVAICGMGGSAFPGDIVSAGFGHVVPVYVSRDYTVPSYPGRGLYIVSSFSGNTEETLAALSALIERGETVAVVTAGGKLEAYADKHRLPCARLKKPSPTFQPRAASGMFVAAFVRIMVSSGLLDRDAAWRTLDGCASTLKGIEGLESAGVAFAERIGQKTPIFYSTGVFVETVAQVSKIKFNENSKIPSFYGALPEFNHNEMVGYTQRHGQFVPVFFRDAAAPVRMVQRLDTSVATLRDHGLDVVVVDLDGGDVLERVYRALLVMDYASIALAYSLDIDPNPVQMVEGFKASLGPFSGY